jgi:phospholipid/cholesterol/gamma-HCH transport system substrate-binding protein
MKIDKELAVGVFLLIGIFSLIYISVKLGKLEVLGREGYTLYASFENAGGLKSGASVEIAGVKIGTVESVKLNNYQALVGLTIAKNVKIQDDAIASIKTAGLIGEKYVEITPGASDKTLRNGGTIRETESAIDIEDLIAKYAFGKV